VGAVGFAFAGLWAFALVMNSIVARLVGPIPMMDMMKMVWPEPGLAIVLTGLVSSLLLAYLARRFKSKPDLLLDIGSAFLVITCLLVGLLEQWVPMLHLPQLSWIALVIVIYASIVPNRPGTTLGTGLIAASMGPLGLLVAGMRGVDIHASAFVYAGDFAPNYIAAVVAVIPSQIIRGLGQQVRRARELGSYRLEEELGKGGMGEVYRASHQMLARPAAVKLIRPEVLGGTTPGAARVMLERFRREAEAAASLRSPHTISLYDFGAAHDGTFFFVMELLDGIDLESLIQRFGPVPSERAAYLLRQACHSLAEAHARGLVHRDIKPSNIFTCRMGLEVDFVKVLDFGLVKNTASSPDQSRLTAPDSTAGTPAYIAPEIVRGDAVVDHRVDIYALGCVAYWLVTGQLVFEAPNGLQLMFRHANAQPVAPSKRTELEIPTAFDQVVLACLAKRPEDRPQSAGDLSRQLEAAVAGREWNAERAERWWQRHHPEQAKDRPAPCDKMLTKEMGRAWNPSGETQVEEATA
jgi:serine/threonine-protein kinase